MDGYVSDEVAAVVAEYASITGRWFTNNSAPLSYKAKDIGPDGRKYTGIDEIVIGEGSDLAVIMGALNSRGYSFSGPVTGTGRYIEGFVMVEGQGGLQGRLVFIDGEHAYWLLAKNPQRIN